MKKIYSNRIILLFKQKILLPTCTCLLLLCLLFAGCEEFVEVEPPRNEIVRDLVFSNDATAVSAISGVYSNMINIFSSSFTNTSIEEFTGLYADEFFTASNNLNDQEFASNELLPTNSTIEGVFWGSSYSNLLNINAILEGLSTTESITDSVGNQLEGEAKFLRAFFHFYLVNLFGAIPLATSTNVEANTTAIRVTESEVYAQIIKDLEEAELLMESDFSFSGDQRVRPNQGAATALLARTYLYTEDWARAAAKASEVIDNADLYTLEADLNQVFLANASEAIWQLRPVNDPNFLTPQVGAFVLTVPPSPSGRSIALTDDFYNSFEAGDSRRDNWVGELVDGADIFRYPFKYQNTTSPFAEYSTMLRLAELYLIRAEARAQMGDLANAISDLDAIRGRAGLPLISDLNPTISQGDLLGAIEQERRVELFVELGHRWLDLKRTGRATEVLQPLKPEWQATDVLFPVPEREILENPNLLPQNAGY